MGGFGSGRHCIKGLVGNMLALDVRRLHRAGKLQAEQFFEWHWTQRGEPARKISIRTYSDRITLIYRVRSFGGEWQDMNYPVYLSWTRCNYGGKRAWWLCPVMGCGRRVAVLYGGCVYACRHCNQLAYRTQRENPGERADSKAEKLRLRLAWQPGILNGNGSKPKGMHWTTYYRLEAQHDSLVKKSLSAMISVFPEVAELIDVPW